MATQVSASADVSVPSAMGGAFQMTRSGARRQSVQPESVSVQDAADLLSVSVSTVRRMIAARQLPNAFKVRKVIRIPREDVTACRERGRIDV